MASTIGDIRDGERLKKAVREHRPSVVFHLAAQPLVRYSYQNPVETFETNVTGTANLLEACRGKTASVRAVVGITSDKCYENREWMWGYRENDPLGGYDPYSASKACSELVIGAYRSSFFNVQDYGRTHKILLSSARAGNVIGGGDWAQDRLIPDIMRAISEKKKLIVRNPRATRPWQHVLDPLAGYLMLGRKLLEGEKEFAQGWNFGPGAESEIRVEDVVKGIKRVWDRFEYGIQPAGGKKNKNPHEAGMLRLDCTKALSRLGWRPNWNCEKALDITTKWYKRFYEERKACSAENLELYIKDAVEEQKNMEWVDGPKGRGVRSKRPASKKNIISK